MGDIELLKIIDHLPAGLLESPSHDLHQLLPQPTLIHLQGRRQPALFVSVLLHGNEDAGLKAIQTVLRKYAGSELPRALSIFFGNISAARDGVRRLDGQQDFNRVWPGTESPDSEETAMAQAVVEEMRRRGVFASIDIHNNTGLNPHYGCINKLEPAYLHFAALFSRIAVYFIRPKGVQSMAFADLCPAITIECGKAGSKEGEAHAATLVEDCLHLSAFPTHPVAAHDLDLFHTVGTVKVPESIRFTFGEGDADVHFDAALDHMNFRELPAGSRLGRTTSESPPLQVVDEAGSDVTGRYFEVRGGELLTRRTVMPSMLTLDERVIRQDCLCYLMERFPIPG
jgi:succinylglutamate desuccinylase